MTVEAFKEIANKALSDYTKDKEGKYRWSDWWPDEYTSESQTVVFNYRAKLRKSDNDSLIGTMETPKELNEEEGVARITKWLDENLKDQE